MIRTVAFALVLLLAGPAGAAEARESGTAGAAGGGAAASAEGKVLDQHLDAQVHAVDGALVTAENGHWMLAAWVRAQG